MWRDNSSSGFMCLGSLAWDPCEQTARELLEGKCSRKGPLLKGLKMKGDGMIMQEKIKP